MKTFLSVLVLAALLPGMAAAEEKFTLAYKFQPSEKVRWEVVHRATITTTIQGTTQSAQTLSESIKVWQVTKLTDPEISFTHWVESIKMTNKLPNRAEVIYDSLHDAEPPAGYEDAARAVGVPLTEVRIDPQGKILHRQQKLIQPGNSDDMPIAMPLPAEPIAIGDTWGDPHEITLKLQDGRSQKVTTRQRFELKSVDDGIATIATDYQILTPIRDPAIQAQIMQRIAGGEIQFDLEKGRVVSQHLKVDERVLGFSGPASSMHYLSTMDERLLGPHEKLARKPER